MTNPTDDTPLTLVLGATGKTGRRVVDGLTARGVPVRAASRSGHPPFAWDDPDTWDPALRGVSAAYLAFAPDLAVPGAAETIAAFAALAVDRGVERLVLLSGRGEEGAERAELAVRRAGVAWTIVRCSFFDQNFSESVWLDDILGGVVALPVGDVREPFVDVDDVAAVAVAALTEPRHAGELYELTGPRTLSFEEAVREIAEATGRDVDFVSPPLDEYLTALDGLGLPPGAVALLTYLLTEVLDGRNAHVADGVQRALGRAPRDFRDDARDTARTGVWHADARDHARG